jgi:lipopolysaccharide biosynthesis glycosyltransferase
MRDLLAITDSIPIPTCPRTFCTIITSNYLPYALNLLNSIRDYDQDVHVNILISDSSRLEFDAKTPDSESFFKFPEDVTNEGIGLKIMDKYRDLHHDTFRWSCKSIFINHLILECGYKKVIYVDCDIFFFSPFSFLFDALDTHRVLLTPHWRTSHPNCNPEEYRLLFSDGLYNAGFIGVNSNAVDVMDWWAENCLYSCAKASFPGEYDDQAILNLMPLYFEGVHILRHKGCNVAVWNQHVCRRTMKPDGSILINDEFPIVFVHFVSEIPKEFDPMLAEYLDRYMERLRSFSEEIWLHETTSRLLDNWKPRSNAARG